MMVYFLRIACFKKGEITKNGRRQYPVEGDI